jgi:two-component system sensor histidine kinase/response regulator
MSAEHSQILVVDDDFNDREILLNLLDRKGYIVLFSSDGTSGVQRAASAQPDLILLDVLMPDMDGFETCRQLKSNKKTKDIPVIFMTAWTETDDKVKGFESGAIDYITKPFDPEEVLARINTHLSMRKLTKNLHMENQELLEKHTAVSKQMEDLRLNLSRILPHEFRTPLNGILGFSEFLISFAPDQLPKSDEILCMQTAIHNNALRLKRIIENYLLYADLRLMEYEPERRQEMWQAERPLSPKALIASVALAKAEKVQRKEDLRLDLIDIKVWISEKGLQKIVEELVDNALKFSESGTPIQVTTEVNSHQWVLKITDQGRGMTVEQIADIGAYMQFERRYYEQQGVGLGLIITRLLVQLNHGRLTIESLPKQGTTVTVVFNRKK